MKNFISITCLFLLLSLSGYGKTIKVLAIGNSFSVDAVEQNLYELAAAQGDSLIIGNAYIGGCSLRRHMDCLNNHTPRYSYRKIVGGQKITKDKTTLQSIVCDERWDIVTFQQSSPLSGISDSYAVLDSLKCAVSHLITNKQAKYYWHMTWAYAQNSTHKHFKDYGSSQQTMYDAILSVSREEVPKVGIHTVIPSGVAIQNARLIFGDVMNRDGYHLSDLGRYVAACTWLEIITGKSVIGNHYWPSFLNQADAAKVQVAAHNANVTYKF